MRPIFTIHAGEYLVCSYIEKHFKNLNIWVPSKDSGIDFILTNKNNDKVASIQVKFSKDFLPTHFDEFYQTNLRACGWWSLNKAKIRNSLADFWILALYCYKQKDVQHIIIKPQDLFKRLTYLHGKGKVIQSYLQITQKNRCWETRDLNKKDQKQIALGDYKNKKRDFTRYLNNWEPIIEKLK